MKHDVLFLTLRVFSETGGIEKVCRIAGKALYEIGLQSGYGIKIFSMHGYPNSANDNIYFPPDIFTGFSGNKIKNVVRSIGAGRKSGTVILSHINLLLVGYLIKKINPSVKLIMLAHGIEVWQSLPAWKKRMLNKCDMILPVSNFTKQRMIELHKLPPEKFTVLNNCLDPFLQKTNSTEKNAGLMKRYGLSATDKVLLTVARVAATEQYKGYDKILHCLPALLPTYPSLKYLIVGKYDEKEKQRLTEIINTHNLHNHVVITGFVKNEELQAHYNLADVFVMPSEKEGFGIVFIEAMFYGKPVIAGNKDGSTDALADGKLGVLVNPESENEITAALLQILANTAAYLPNEELLKEKFSYTAYKEKLKSIIESNKN